MEGTSVTSDDIQKAAEEIDEEEKNDQKIQQDIEADGGLSANQLKSIGDTIDGDNSVEDPNGAYAVVQDKKDNGKEAQK